MFFHCRFLNLANPSRILATANPTFEDFLPVDDERFADVVRCLAPLSFLHKDFEVHSLTLKYAQTSQPEDAVTMSQGFVFKIGHFGRLAQATYLISQVLDSIRSVSVMPDYLNGGNLPADVAQLYRTIEALVRANEMEITARGLAFCCQSLVSYR